MLGLLGNSGTGKSTLLDTLLDNEHPDGMEPTMNLTCANARIYKCSSSDAPCYRSCRSVVDLGGHQCESPGHEQNQMSVWKHVSFVDCPGDIHFVSTMLAGIAMTDVVFVLSTLSEKFSFGPMSALLAAANAMGKSIVILQNHMVEGSGNVIQVDQEYLRQIQEFKDVMSISRDIPVVGLSAKENANNIIGELCQQIDRISIPEHDVTSPALMIIAQTFVLEDTGNGDEAIRVTIRGRVTQGVISINQEVEVRPGVVKMGDDGKSVCCPVMLKVETIDPSLEDDAMAGQIVSLTAVANGDHQLMKYVIEGGLAGHKLGHVGSLPGVYRTLKVKVVLFPKMVHLSSEELEEVEPLQSDEGILLTVGTMSFYCKVSSITEDMIMVVSGFSPTPCVRQGEHVFISRKQVLAWNLIGHGEIVAGRPIKVVHSI